MHIAFAESARAPAGALVVLVAAGPKLSPTARRLDRLAKGQIARALKLAKRQGKAGEFHVIEAPRGSRVTRLVLAGIGAAKEMTDLGAEALGGRIVRQLGAIGETEASVAIDPMASLGDGIGMDAADFAARVASGARLAAYRFDKYKTKKKSENGSVAVKTLTLRLDGAAAARRAFQPLDKIADGVVLTRDLVSEPANVLYPESLAKRAKDLAKLGVEVDVLTEAQMRKLGMNALLGVGQGSVRKPCTVIMEWNGLPKGTRKKPVAFVGKGVTFDTGGISIKPAAGMEDMKWDMGGAGVVIGLMKALAGRKAKVHAVGAIGLVENMPDGNAQRPGDIVTSMSGQTIEVLNTDAEGRLVLADVLWYTQDRFKPEAMIDLATLTGAIIVALGEDYAGLFSNDDALAEKIAAASKATDEKVWRLPLDDAFDRMIDGDAADVKNIGSGRSAGSITAAQFLQRFVNKVPWAHLDIAGVTWSKKDRPTTPKGGTGFGVRLLDRLVADHFEQH